MAVEKNTVASLMIPVAPTVRLDTDSGGAGDNVTNFGLILIEGLLPGATWEYSADSGATWITGVDEFIDQPVADGDYFYLVRQTDTAGTTSAFTSLSFTLDTFADPPIIKLERDTDLAGDNVTTNGTIKVIGLDPGALWEYRENGGAWVTGTGDRFTLSGAGQKSVEVRASDSVGNISNATALAFELRNIPAPTLNLAVDSNVAGDHITNDGTVAVAGLFPGATWQYSVDGGTHWIQGSGTSITLTGDGTKNIVVRQTNVGGLTSDPSAILTFVLDSAVVTPTLALAIDTEISTDAITTDGTVNVTGLESGASWQYSLDAGATWIAGTGSSFVLAGEGQKDVIVQQIDVAGNVAQSASLSFILTDDTAPIQTVTIDSVIDDVGVKQGNMISGDSTDDDSFEMAGSLSAALMPGYQVAIYQGTTFLGYAAVTGTNWSYSPGALALGNHSLSAHVVNLGNGLSGADSIAFEVNIVGTITIDAVLDFAGASTGPVADGATTDDATPSLSGRISAPLAVGEQVGVYDGNTLLGYATLNAARTGWSFTPSVLPAGDHVFTVKVETASGTELLASGTHTITLVPQVAATLDITEVSDNVLNGGFVGRLADGQTTDDATLFMRGTSTGTINVGDSVVIYDGATRLGTATVNRTSGEWSFTTPALVGDGQHALTARVENASSGLIGSASDAFDVNLLKTITITQVIDNVGMIQGDITAGATTDDSAPSLLGSLSATLTAGERVAIYDGLIRLGYATVNGTTWAYHSVANPLSGGMHDLQAKIENAAGEVLVASSPHPINVVPQVVATLAITEVSDSVLDGGFVGRLTDGQSTDDARLFMAGRFTGTLNAGDSVVIYDGAVRLGTASVNKASGQWSYTTPALAGDGQHALSARVENPLSGQIGMSSGAFHVNLVSLAITHVVDNMGSHQGDIAAGGITDDHTPKLLGSLSATLAAGEHVAIYNGLIRLGYATVSGTTWSYDHSPLHPLWAGAHHLQAKIESATGDVLVASAAHLITVSTLLLSSPDDELTLVTAGPITLAAASFGAYSTEVSEAFSASLLAQSAVPPVAAQPQGIAEIVATHVAAIQANEVNLNHLEGYGFVMMGEAKLLATEVPAQQVVGGDSNTAASAEADPAANEVYLAYGDLGGVALPEIVQNYV